MRQLDKIKEFVKNMPAKTKKMVAIIGGGLIVFSVVLALLLNHKEYAVLFSGLNDSESTEVMAKLQDSGVDYQYNPNGSILVPKNVADKTRATMAMEGYPKSGFTYDTFINNAGLMSTESDKETYKLYDLQNRIGATIRTLDGVKSALVTITPGTTQKYVLDNNTQTKPSAYVVVTMNDGGSPSSQQVSGIQRLVAKAVPDMDLGDVAVIDGNGVDVSVVRNDQDSTTASNDKKTEYETKVELQVEQKVLNVLEPIYGRNNVRVSVKATADMQKIISEEIGYTAPDIENNMGYITHQSILNETSGTDGTAAGVPGADANTNVTQYNTQNGDGTNYSSSSSDTDYALNQKKVQGQSDSGAIVDMSVAVTLNNKTEQEVAVQRNEIIGLVARAAGIDPEVQATKIAVVSAGFYDNTALTGVPPVAVTPEIQKYLPLIIGGLAALFVLLFILLIVKIIIKRRKKRRQQLEQEMMVAPSAPLVEAVMPAQSDINEELLAIKNDRGLKLKSDIREFAGDNPEISASLLKNWLRGGDDNG